MAASVVVGREAEQDVADAADWYESRRRGQGVVFLSRVHECLTTVSRVPMGGQPLIRGYRKAWVRKFPHIVAYKNDSAAKVVEVFAVFHTSRDPDDLLGRLP